MNLLNHTRARRALLALGIGVLALSQGATGDAQSTQDRARGDRDYKHDTSKRLGDIPPKPYVGKAEHEANRNPRRISQHRNQPEAVAQTTLAAPAMPSAGLNFEGIGYPGVACNCAPPDTNGEVGSTQYVQIVNEGFQVFNKSTGASAFGPVNISTLWSGFGGVCESNGSGDPIVNYDQLADRWVVSQFAGASVPTDECVAVSTTGDATGSYYRYAFHLGTNLFDYPKIAVWPDAYYMSMNVFNASGTAYLGPQPFAFNRTAMLTGSAASFVTTGVTGGSSEETYLPADMDGKTLPPAGAPNTFVEFPNGGVYKLFHFHADFATPANSTFTLFATPPVAGFTELCATTRGCVPQSGTTSRLDGMGDRLMFRAAYRNAGDHESLVTNYTVNSGGVAGVRWLELRNVTFGPATVFQESTYQPDTTWRWLGSAAMDGNGDLAVGFSASSSSINPQIRFAGRLATDPLNTLAQGEATLFAGTGSQTGTGSRWGDYSALSVDPVDDCTFWYTSEYYAITTSFNWHTRIGTFKFPGCGGADFSLSASPAALTMAPGGSGTSTITVAPSGGFAGPVSLSVSGVPTGATGAFNPTSATSTSVLTLDAGTAAPGTYSLTVTGTGGGLTHTTSVSLVVTAPGSFSLSAAPASLTVRRGNTGTYTVTITRTAGFSGAVALSVSGLPSGVTGTFNPSSVTGTSSALTITAAGSAQRATRTLTITGTSAGAPTKTTTVTLTVR